MLGVAGAAGAGVTGGGVIPLGDDDGVGDGVDLFVQHLHEDVLVGLIQGHAHQALAVVAGGAACAPQARAVDHPQGRRVLIPGRPQQVAQLGEGGADAGLRRLEEGLLTLVGPDPPERGGLGLESVGEGAGQGEIGLAPQRGRGPLAQALDELNRVVEA